MVMMNVFVGVKILVVAAAYKMFVAMGVAGFCVVAVWWRWANERMMCD